MRMISDPIFSSIRQKVLLSSQVGRWVKLVRNGRTLKGLCPFHNEKTPSFTVDDVKGFYHCFGCGAHGDVIDFVRQKDGLSVMDAVRQLAEGAGIDMSMGASADTVARRKVTKDLYAVTEAACQWFQSQLSKNEKVLAYLRDRGVSPQAIQDFRLGWASGKV